MGTVVLWKWPSCVAVDHWGSISGRLKHVIVVAIWLVSTGVGYAAEKDVKLNFDIQAQPLADALVAFGERADLEIFYDGHLAIGQRSAVHGEFAPSDALDELLRGTGYASHPMPGMKGMTIEPARAARDMEALNQHASYFGRLQRSLIGSLCAVQPSTADMRIVANVWLNAAGGVVRADVFGLSQSPDSRDRVSAALLNARMDEAPPTGLPQPVTLAIYPPHRGETGQCADHPGHGRPGK